MTPLPPSADVPPSADLSPGTPFSRRRMLQATGVGVLAGVGSSLLTPGSLLPRAAAAVVAPVRPDTGALASEVPFGAVQLRPGRWLQNQARTLNYLHAIDVDRLLYTFRVTHGLDTRGAQPCAGWEGPNFPFRTHSQGHFLTAWAQVYAVTGDSVSKQKMDYMVAELAACQANNAAVGWAAGYLSGFPETEFDRLETDNSSSVIYYSIHKTLAGLLDVWRLTGSTQARDVLLGFAGWVDQRTAGLTREHMQRVLRTEFGGMNAVLADLAQMTGDLRWMEAARRFDHDAVFTPLANGQDALTGLHANTQVPKWIGAIREYKVTGEDRYRTIATNAWTITTTTRTYAPGGNSEAEHFRAPGALARYLDGDTMESCNTYNMLKLTRELWMLEPDRVDFFDFYERALINHLIGTQDPQSEHGHICYFTGTQPGARRAAVGPLWGGGNWSTDYGTFWCCQGTMLETHTKLMDSIYFIGQNSLTVNLFAPSSVRWAARSVQVVQATEYPVTNTTSLTVTRTSRTAWTMRIRIPGWTSDPTVTVNGTPVAATPGTYAEITRTWRVNDRVHVTLPMAVALEPTPDNPDVQAIVYGPVVLSGNYGNRAVRTMPTLDPATITRAEDGSLAFTATADDETVQLGPFHDAHHHNYVVYWNTGEPGPVNTLGANFKLVNAATGLVLGIQNASTADDAPALQWRNSGTADHDWGFEPVEGTIKLKNSNSAKYLAVRGQSTTAGARAAQYSDGPRPDLRWDVVDTGDGRHKLRNRHADLLLSIQDASTSWGAAAVLDPDDGAEDTLWRFLPVGSVGLRNVKSGLLIGFATETTADGAPLVQRGGAGGANQFWTAVVNADRTLRFVNAYTQKCLGVEGQGSQGARAVQLPNADQPDRRWILRHKGAGEFRIETPLSGRGLAVQNGSLDDGAQVLVWTDTGTADQRWRLV